MKKIILAACLLPVLFGCDCGDEGSRETEKTALKCGIYDVKIEIVGKDFLKTSINGEKIEMRHAVSADGAKYEGKGAVVSAALWNKGTNWMLLLDDGRPIDCKVLK